MFIGITQLDVSQATDDFQDFAAGWEHSAAGAFVGIQGLHEGDLVDFIVPLASSRVDLPASFLAAASRFGGGVRGAICFRLRLRATLLAAAVDLDFSNVRFDGLRHGFPKVEMVREVGKVRQTWLWEVYTAAANLLVGLHFSD